MPSGWSLELTSPWAWLFWASIAFIAFTYVGYPVLIFAWARLRRRPIARAAPAPGAEPLVTVVVCGHNEARNWPAKLATLAAQTYPKDKIELIVVDDGSTDASPGLLADAAEHEPWRGRMRVLRNEQRSGKPSGLNQAVAAARGEVIFFNDARQRLNPEALAELVANLGDPQVGAAGGELVLEGEGGAGAYWAYEAWIRKQEGRVGSTLGVSGAIYVLRKDLYREIPADTVLDDMLIPLTAHLLGKRIVFEPGANAYDKTADTAREFGRKARTLAGNFQLFARRPALLVPWKNPSWLQLWCHKVFRLLVPYALVAALIASLVLARESRVYLLAAGAQGLAYLGALLGALLGKRAGKLMGLCHTFVALNLAAVVGFWRWLTGGQRITW